jgi:hypothetical protein
MTSLKLSSFKNGNANIREAVPPIIFNKAQADSIKNNAQNASDMLAVFQSGNFFMMLILGGSMQ